MRTFIIAMGVGAACACGSTPSAPTPPADPSFVAAFFNGWLSGVVTDEVSGEPLAGVVVEWAWVAEAFGDSGDGVITGRDGTYRVQVQWPNIGMTLRDGLFTVRATRAGYISQDRRVTVPRSGASTADFHLVRNPSGTVSGIVRDLASGQPIEGVQVEWTGLAEGWGDRGHGVKTNELGMYRLTVRRLGGPGSAEGAILMRASKAGFASRTVQVTVLPDAVVNFELEPGSDEPLALSARYDTDASFRSRPGFFAASSPLCCSSLATSPVHPVW